MEHTELLLKVFFFTELTPVEIATVATVVERRHYRTGQKVFQQGDASDSFYMIESGSVMVKNGPMYSLPSASEILSGKCPLSTVAPAPLP